MADAIAIKELSKSFKGVAAVNSLDLNVKEGSFFGFLGPNGAGKTTTIRSIVGLCKYDSGSITVFGHDVVHDYVKAKPLIGLSPQDFIFDNFLTLEETLIYQGGYYGVPHAIAKQRAQKILKQFGLYERRQERPMTLSGGMKRRLLIAKALVHEPKILILDEPTAGVDVELRYQLWQFLTDAAKRGVTIFLTTHYIEEAERLCDTIGVIHHGKLIKHGSTKDLMAELGQQMVTIKFAEPIEEIPNWLTPLGAKYGENKAILIVKTGGASTDLNALLKRLYSHHLTIENIDIQKDKLEDIFLQLTGQSNGQ